LYGNIEEKYILYFFSLRGVEEKGISLFVWDNMINKKTVEKIAKSFRDSYWYD